MGLAEIRDLLDPSQCLRMWLCSSRVEPLPQFL